MISPLVLHQNDKTKILVRIISVIGWWKGTILSKLVNQALPSPFWKVWIWPI